MKGQKLFPRFTEKKLLKAIRISFSVAGVLTPLGAAVANPVGENVVAGSASFDRPDSQTLIVNQEKEGLEQ